MALRGTLDLYARDYSLFLQRDRKRLWTNPMLHEQTYCTLTCFVIREAR